MRVDIFIELKGQINSTELWEDLEATGANVTDLGDQTLVYGNIDIASLAKITTTCAIFSEDIHIHATRPIN